MFGFWKAVRASYKAHQYTIVGLILAAISLRLWFSDVPEARQSAPLAMFCAGMFLGFAIGRYATIWEIRADALRAVKKWREDHVQDR